MRVRSNSPLLRFVLVVLGLLLAYTVYAASSTVKVTKAKMTLKQNNTQLILSLSGLATYKVFTLQHPQRVVLDIENAKLMTPLPKVPAHSAVKDIRLSQSQGRLRWVFDLNRTVTPQAFLFQPKKNSSYRLVLALNTATSSTAVSDAIPAGPTPALTVPLNVANTGRPVIVVIDPGHGGKDPGTTGYGGVKEKNVVLAISKQLQQLINAQPGMRAVLTRNSDYYITLRERLTRARDDKADIFVAIHADAYKDNSATGASVYALSQRGATSEAARWLAEKENNSELGGVNLDDKSYVLRSVLIDLSQTATIGSSLQLGSYVLSSIGHMAPLHYTHVEQARFVVLKSPDIPSILVETGFLSNASQARLLNNASFQKKMAQAIMKGIQNYFYQTPPPGTWFAAHRSDVRQYRVMRGDTLASVADHFSVSVAKLKQANNLRSNSISLGQVLNIPQVNG